MPSTAVSSGWRAGIAAAPRRPAAAAAAATAGRGAPGTPLPLLPFWNELRSQLSRLEGVEALPVPPALAAAQCASPALALRAGACHSDRLRHGRVLYVNATGLRSHGRGRPPSSSSSGDGGGGGTKLRRGSLSLLQGELLPSLYSFHPPLCFQVAAFNGGESWMVSVDNISLEEADEGEQGAAADGAAAGASSSGGSGGSSSADGGRDSANGGRWQQQGQQQQEQQGWEPGGSSGGAGTSGDGACSTEAVTPAGWQAQQAQRLAAVRGMYLRAAVPPPASPLRRQPGAGWPSPAHLLLSSSQLVGEGPAARRAALDSAALPAFRTALSVHLNGLAQAPADASPAHMRRVAATQQRHLAAVGRRPLLCGEQLEQAFGREWCAQLQAWLLADGQVGLEVGAAAEDRQAGEEWVYLDPRMLPSVDGGA